MMDKEDCTQHTFDTLLTEAWENYDEAKKSGDFHRQQRAFRIVIVAAALGGILGVNMLNLF